MKIEVDVSDLKQTGKSLKTAANEIEEIRSGLQRAMSRLTMESRSRSNIEGTFHQVNQRLSELQEELQSLSALSIRKGDQFADDDAYGQQVKSSKWWKVFQTGVSLALDFVPIIGNAKGLVEAVTGRDLITGQKLAAWERGLGVLGPFGKGVKTAAKLTRFADEAIEGVTFVARHADDAADFVKQADKAAEAGEGLATAERVDDAAKSASTAAAADRMTFAGRGSGTGKAESTAAAAAQTADGLTAAEREAATGLAIGGAGTAAGVLAGAASQSGKAAHMAEEAAGAGRKSAQELAAGTGSAKGAASVSASAEVKQTQNLTVRNANSLVDDPIHTGTGDQLMENKVLQLYGAAAWPILIQYHSGLLQESEMGVAWTHNYALSLDIEAAESEPSSLIVHWNAARQNRFELHEDGIYRSRDLDVQWDELHRSEDGFQLKTRAKQDRFDFTPEGKLIRHRNAEGFQLRVAHNEQGTVERLTDVITGRRVSFQYNEGGLLTKIQDEARSVHFEYDDSRHMIRMLDANGHTTDMTYDPEGRLLSLAVEGEVQFENTFDAEHRIIAQTNPAGRASRLHYDTESQPGSVVTTFTDALNRQTRYVHDERYLLAEVEYPDGRWQRYTYNEAGQETECVYSDGRTEQKTYDEQGRLIRFTDALGYVTQFGYNEQHQVIREINAEQQETTYTYDGLSRLIRVTRPDGSYAENRYQEAGQLAAYRDFSGAVRSFLYGEHGELAGWEDAEGRPTRVFLDEAGRISLLEDAAGARTIREYDGKDNLILTRDALGHTWTSDFDPTDQLLQRTDPSGAVTTYTYTPTGQLASQTDPLGHSIQYEYDEADRLVAQIDPEGRRTELAYDAGDRLTLVTDPLGRTTSYHYDAAGRLDRVTDGEGRTVTELTYDALGRPLAVTNGLGHTTRYRFNALGQVQETADAAGRTVRYKYDAAARLVEVVEAEQAVYRQEFDGEDRLTAYADANGNRTEVGYDRSGLLIEERNAAGQAILYGYDPRGLLATRTNARQQQTHYRYDAAGRLIERSDEAGEVKLSYDANGRITSLSEGEAEMTRSYDAAGQVLSSTDTFGNTLRYAYDASGRLTELTYPDGKAVHYRYNAAGELSEVKDWRGRLTRYRYDQSGKLIETNRPNGSREKRSYDVAGQLIRLSDQTVQGILLQKFDFTYNEIGQIIQEEDRQYTYDQFRRLSSGSSRGRITRYAYDLGGNLTESQGAEGQQSLAFSYTADNRLKAIGDYPVEMDADGNLLYQSDGEGMAAYEYDARNRLVKSGKARYTYNALGSRTSLTWRGKTTHYVVDEQGELSRVLMEVGEGGSPKAYYVYGLGLIGREDADGNYVSYHSDIRGSTTLLTDEQGCVTDRYTYGLYGELEQHEGTSSQPFCYNGRDGVMTDPNGLYYMRARYYDPSLKRFLNRDVLRGDLTDGQTLNRYAYVNGDPVRYVDPLGLCKVEGTGNLLDKPTAGDNIGSNLRPQGAGKADDFAKETFLPDEYYKNNYAPMQGTPGARVDFSRLGSSGQVEDSRVIYDQAGKQKYRIDYTDHGNSFHHTDPHMHEYIYQDAGKSIKTEIKYFVEPSTGRLRQGIIDETRNKIKFID
ncbi:hypothetical protein AWM70_12530 [Paenibacillus yonginensis]|uniref:Uncharacterized protein n=1 Tax=Paenibacillus yonginensis TaxID=1462996 RepID=A0A1B1N1L9_9BACL|nr:RHS repeat-associated core domain-containing protein [Paenibacillus yonginensis]ANS75330.1 hypothetical protein AWM70_12530 [Paenibacillus yonginensis]